jgi:23S rRNA pseudouridine2605 synthase
MSLERVQKILASSGLGSRRACETLIEEGRVQVNGKTIQIGAKADPATDRITLDGAPIQIENLKYILLNKPKGVVSSLNSQGNRPTVRDLVPHALRLYPVGRLDLESEGLILMTNDGELANHLTHPRYGVEKEYLVYLDGHPRQEQLDTWRRGVVLDGKWARPVRVSIVKKSAAGTQLRVVMKEGRKQQIRRTAQAIGLWVKKLVRIRMGPILLGDLNPGEWRELRPDELAALGVGTKNKVRGRPVKSTKKSRS